MGFTAKHRPYRVEYTSTEASRPLVEIEQDLLAQFTSDDVLVYGLKLAAVDGETKVQFDVVYPGGAAELAAELGGEADVEIEPLPLIRERIGA